MMIEFLSAAAQEASDAAAHYEACVPGLGSEFTAELERVANLLSGYSAAGAPLDEKHRRIPLNRFPYALIYSIDVSVVRIVAVTHRRRSPAYWYPRVQDREDAAYA